MQPKAGLLRGPEVPHDGRHLQLPHQPSERCLDFFFKRLYNAGLQNNEFRKTYQAILLQVRRTAPISDFCHLLMVTAFFFQGTFTLLSLSLHNFFRGVSLPPNREQGYQSSLPSPRVITDTIMREALLVSFLLMSIFLQGGRPE